MSKKNFLPATNPISTVSLEAVDAFVQGGAGQDTKKLKTLNVGNGKN
jgi:hypothetical protein